MHKSLSLKLFIYFIFSISLFPCTFLSLSMDGSHYFCNNEDVGDPRAFFWIVPSDLRPGGGAIYLGSSDLFSQGGMNDQGLCFDWVAGDLSNYRSSPQRETLDGVVHQEMLDNCSTLEEALGFMKTHNEEGFGYAKMLLSDSLGQSAILQYRRGAFMELTPHGHADDPSIQYLLAGYGNRPITKSLREREILNIQDMAELLFTGRQWGGNPTVYSNIFIPETRDIYLFDRANPQEYLWMNLHDMISQGESVFEISPQFSRLEEMEVDRRRDGCYVFSWSGTMDSHYRILAGDGDDPSQFVTIFDSDNDLHQGRRRLINPNRGRFQVELDNPPANYWMIEAQREGSPFITKSFVIPLEP